jgi:hypothetical protein
MTQRQLDPNWRFQIALDQARAAWAAVDPAHAAARAGCALTPEGILVSFFGRPHLVTHPDGAVTRSDGKLVHASIVIVLLHYLLTADRAAPLRRAAPAADRWITFRELPDGLFYAQAFASHAETPLAQKFGEDLAGFRKAATALGGTPLDPAASSGLVLADAGFRFQAFPRIAITVLIWAGDEEFPARARVLFDANAGHYLPTEDLSGVGDWLAHRLARSA